MPTLFPITVSSTDILQAGSYTVELVSVRPGKGRSFDDKPTQPTITFCFKEASGGTPINRTVAATTDSRGRLLEFVRQLAGNKQPTNSQINNPQELQSFIEDLVGKRFKASIAPSNSGRFNNIMSIHQLEGGV